MGYAGARGGDDAILAAEELVRRGRDSGGSEWLATDQIIERLRFAVDRVMGEAGLWAPDLAARAIRQSEGDVLEAAQLLRAHRSTLPRLAYSEAVPVTELRALRRISSAFRNPPGRQILGRTLDYVGRLLDLMPEDEARAAAEPHNHQPGDAHAHSHSHSRAEHADRYPPRVLNLLRGMDLLVERRTGADPEPYDITRSPARPGAPRSAVLSALARAETGALTHLWYTQRFDPRKPGHEIPGEVRHGSLPVRVRHPVTGNPVTVTEVRATDVETFDDLDRPTEDRSRIDVGYGLCFGHNERKAIAMAGLDLAVHRDAGATGVAQEVLMTLDGVEASGFLEHLKLPHYVDFRSTLERKQAMRAARTDSERKLVGAEPA
ncbi:MAG TPA: carbon-phosphorus lyase complex subunit PhnI [Mycobacteriales bacterium]|jgi:alpha-D-ribose 1-methylphosphonate 5-triphosphate synthase subunit PhnI|nr:carbon-phosphorus lyase complex subunit PhnI [Mycobacteriales bacterium]